MKQTHLKYFIPFFIITFICGCKKDFLDKKPNSNLVVPESLSDFQKLIDYTDGLNKTSALPQLSADEYYILDYPSWQAATPTERNSYVWDKDVFGGEVNRLDWNAPYTSIFYANSILEQIKKVPRDVSNGITYDDICGQAFFVRAFAFFDLAKSFAMPYDSSAAASNLGVPLKLSPNVDETVQRSTLQETYFQIITDLGNAIALLKPSLPTSNRNRASKISAYGLMARIYLSMRKYDKAELYTDSSLSLYNTLINYNTVSTTSNSPFTNTNAETTFWASQVFDYANTVYRTPVNTAIDTVLYNLYNVNDLRRSIYFSSVNGQLKAKKTYVGTGLYPFSGVATDELYLIKAECLARRGKASECMTSLNSLLVNRYKTGTFVPLVANDSQDALQKVLTERRKELVWRGLRWDDLRRLNKEGANITIKRILNGQIYVLAPNDSRYTFNIPADEIALSGIQQNDR